MAAVAIARLETSQFKRLRSRPLAATDRDCKYAAYA